MTLDPRPSKEGRLQFLEVEGVVEEAGQEAARQGAYPIDAPVGPVGGSERGTQGAGGVEGASGEGIGDHDPDSEGQADGEARDGARGGLVVVYGGGEDDQDQEEGGDGFQDHGGQA